MTAVTQTQALGFIMRHVPNVEQARDFYAGQLGLTIEMETPGFVQFAGMQGGTSFALGEAGHGDPVELWWYVGDADAAHTALRASGVEIVSPPADMPFGRTLTVKDPAGNSVYLLQPRA